MEENTPIPNQPPVSQPVTPEAPKPVSLFPPKKTIVLIVILVLITVGLVYLSVSKPSQEVPKTTTTVDFRETSFKISPALIVDPKSTTSATPIYALDIVMETGKNKATAVQFEIKYDHTALTNVDIVPGEKVGNWAELFKRVDTENGIVSYALGISPGQKGVSGAGIVAKLTFSKAAGFEGVTPVSFLPKTMATAEGYDQSTLKKSTGTSFDFPDEE